MFLRGWDAGNSLFNRNMFYTPHYLNYYDVAVNAGISIHLFTPGKTHKSYREWIECISLIFDSRLMYFNGIIYEIILESNSFKPIKNHLK